MAKVKDRFIQTQNPRTKLWVRVDRLLAKIKTQEKPFKDVKVNNKMKNTEHGKPSITDNQ